MALEAATPAAAPATPAAPTKPVAPATPEAKKPAAGTPAAPQEEQRYDAGGRPLPPREKPAEKKPAAKKEPEPADNEAAADEGDGDAPSDRASVADDDDGEQLHPQPGDNDDVENEESEGEGETPVDVTDETEIDVDGEKVSVKALKELHKKAALTERRFDIAQRALNDIAQEKERAVLRVFTSIHGGDPEKGYQELAGMTARVLQDATSYDDIPEDLAKSAISLVQRLAALEQMTPEAREALRLKRRAETAEQRAERLEEEKKQEEHERRVQAEIKKLHESIPVALNAVGVALDNDSWEDIKYFLERGTYTGKPITVEEAAQQVKALHDRRNKPAAPRYEDIPAEYFERKRQEELERARKGRPRPREAAGAATSGNGERIHLPARRPTFG